MCHFQCFFLCIMYSLSGLICSANQRRLALVPRRTGEKGRMHPLQSQTRAPSVAKTLMASVSNPWSSTWPLSTSWRASSLLVLLHVSVRASHTHATLLYRQPEVPETNLTAAVWVKMTQEFVFNIWMKNCRTKCRSKPSPLVGWVLFHTIWLPEAAVLPFSTRWRQSANTRSLKKSSFWSHVSLID